MPLNSPTHKLEISPLKGRLYLIATPIGNMEDITLRALKILRLADFIAAEDTRRTAKLLTHYEIRTRMISYHQHNEAQRCLELIGHLNSGKNVALVSDAGTPLVSDPGYKLVVAAIKNDIMVSPIPGANAAIAALSASGLPPDTFTFIGFPARKTAKRRQQLEALQSKTQTIVFYESPNRIIALLEAVIESLGDRSTVLAREITKKYEEFLRGTASEILMQLKKRDRIKGECTLMVQGKTKTPAPDMKYIRQKLHEEFAAGDESLSVVVKRIAGKYGFSRKKVYATALQIKKDASTQSSPQSPIHTG